MKKYSILATVLLNGLLLNAQQNVGIGTTSPQTKLHVVLTVGGNSGAAQSLLIENNSATTGEASTSFRNGGTSGTGFKAWFLGLNQNRNFSWVYGTSFLTTDTKMLLDSTGRLGIGTTTPDEKLDIVGNLKADTIKPAALKITPSAGLGKILVSDAVGNATWQAGSSINAGSSIGFGVWGDCATNGNIGEYNPVADQFGGIADEFGRSVGISGNFAIVGSKGGNSNKGLANIYQHNGTAWVLMQTLVDATGVVGDNFGLRVAIAGNLAIVGAPNDALAANANQGSVSIFQYNGSNWTLMQKITDATGAAGDNFGSDVSISNNYAIVGSENDDNGVKTDQGSASIYQYNGTAWVLMQKILDLGGDTDDNFGTSVSVSGDFAIVGADQDDIGANTNQGSASIYIFNGTNWVLMQKITDAAGDIADRFANSVSISAAQYVIIGSVNDDVSGKPDQGSVSIYKFNGTTWVLMQKLSDPNGATNDYFGVHVSISGNGNYALVGATGTDVGPNTAQGSATVYMRVGNIWQKLQYITDPGGFADDAFGIGTAIDGDTKRFIIGSFVFPANNAGKAIFGKIN